MNSHGFIILFIVDSACFVVIHIALNIFVLFFPYKCESVA